MKQIKNNIEKALKKGTRLKRLNELAQMID